MKTVFFDVDTQLDFMTPGGALYVPKAERLAARVGELNRRAASRGEVVVSTVDAHAEDDPEFRAWPPHCVVHTTGQAKLQATLLDKRIVIPSEPAAFDLNGVQQVILEKQTTDCFTNANIGELLERLGADRYVVYGVVTEICVKNAANGLLKTGKPVVVVTDAIECLNQAGASQWLAEFQAAGGTLATSAGV